MADGPAGAEAESAGFHRLGDNLAHLGDVGLIGWLQRKCPVTHDEDPYRRVRNQGAEIDVARAGGEDLEVFGEALPVEIEALGQNGGGDILDAFHQLDQLGLATRPDGRKADAAIAHHRRCHAMEGGGRHMAVPDRLAVIMGMDVDETRGHQLADGVDLLAPLRQVGADRRNPPILYAEIGGITGTSRAVDNGAAANDEVHGLVPFP